MSAQDARQAALCLAAPAAASIVRDIDATSTLRMSFGGAQSMLQFVRITCCQICRSFSARGHLSLAAWHVSLRSRRLNAPMQRRFHGVHL
jgi:hypothetical protein